MHPTSTRSARGPHQARTGCGRPGAVLALLAALACLAGCTLAEPATAPFGAPTSPAGTVTQGAGTAASGQQRLAAVSWPAAGVSAA
ncbi:MAG TPA: hypothetical protein VHF26_16565, partial [Trebonia sp.]|nr:hypothetical protein [Trebonia sp.]